MPLYQHGKRTRGARNLRVLLGVAAIVGVSMIIAAYIVSKDLASTTGPKTTVPIVTEVGENDGEMLRVDEALFTFELPIDWKLDSRRNDGKFHFYIWRSTKKGAADRKLTLYVDRMPAEPKIVRLLPVSANGNKLMLGNVSSDCVRFAGTTRSDQQRADNTPFAAKWEDVNFLCDPIEANQTIGTGSIDGGTAVRISGGQGTHNYFFFYEDHNIRPDDKIFTDALRSFQAK